MFILSHITSTIISTPPKYKELKAKNKNIPLIIGRGILVIIVSKKGNNIMNMRIWAVKAVTLCSITDLARMVSRMLPPDFDSLMMASLRTWKSLCGRAKCSQGRPMRDIMMLITPTKNKSKWYPPGFCNLFFRPFVTMLQKP